MCRVPTVIQFLNNCRFLVHYLSQNFPQKNLRTVSMLPGTLLGHRGRLIWPGATRWTFLTKLAERKIKLVTIYICIWKRHQKIKTKTSFIKTNKMLHKMPNKANIYIKLFLKYWKLAIFYCMPFTPKERLSIRSLAPNSKISCNIIWLDYAFLMTWAYFLSAQTLYQPEFV